MGDIDAERLLLHIRRGKGHKDRLVPLPDLALTALRVLWSKHRHPRLLFPNPVGTAERIQQATRHMDRGGVQNAMKAVVKDCGIKKSLDTQSASQLCHALTRTWLKPAPYPVIIGPCQPDHYRTLYPPDRVH